MAWWRDTKQSNEEGLGVDCEDHSAIGATTVGDGFEGSTVGGRGNGDEGRKLTRLEHSCSSHSIHYASKLREHWSESSTSTAGRSVERTRKKTDARRVQGLDQGQDAVTSTPSPELLNEEEPTGVVAVKKKFQHVETNDVLGKLIRPQRAT